MSKTQREIAYLTDDFKNRFTFLIKKL